MLFGASCMSFGVSAFVTAASSQYVVLENPAREGVARPLRGSNASIELLVGRKVVVRGPVTFPLWPGQRARVIDGHPLREDEYLVVRYVDVVEDDPHPIGAEVVVRGSETSFYLPRTGLEVVPVPGSERGKPVYLRKAWRFPRPGGLHVRVVKPIADGTEEGLPEGAYDAGAEVFLKDRDGTFFPSERVEVLDVVSPVPIAEREGVYVRDRATGRIVTVTGPANFLPDPTREEIVRRELSADEARLYGLGDASAPPGGAPRAVSVYVPPSAAILVMGRTRREVVTGPQTRILDFDEELEVLRLSTGRPKSDEEPLETCFLQVEGNKVSDVVRVRTLDHVELEVSLSYRVSFVTRGGSREHWFTVKDYVGLLGDHLGSIVRAAARAAPIEKLHEAATEIVRGAVLGEKGAPAIEEGGGERTRGARRPGRLFDENGMWVYDVEILGVHILDAEVRTLLADAQRAAIVAEAARREEERRLAAERLRARVDGEIHAAQTAAVSSSAELAEARASLERRRAAAGIEVARIERVGRAEAEASAIIAVREAEAKAAAVLAEVEARVLDAKVVAFERQMAALAPELVATLRSLGNQQLAAELSKNVAPLAILGGGSVTEVVERLLGSMPVGARTTVGKVLEAAGAAQNGIAPPAAKGARLP